MEKQLWQIMLIRLKEISINIWKMRNNHEFTCTKGIDVENWFIECYRKYKGHPLKYL